MAEREKLLEVKNLTVTFGKKRNPFTAVNNVSVDFPSGRLTGMIGPDGVGKSSLLSLITGARAIESGEVLSAGGRVLNLVDLTDVYMTFFLPEGIAGKVAIGADARIVLDALPDVPIPAKISFVASVAQFTPKTVETQIERQKLMFRIKAKIDPELLKKYIEYVKTGLPGVAYVKINPDAKWPEFLLTKAQRAAGK